MLGCRQVYFSRHAHCKILLILDNALSHKWNEDEELSNVVLLFLPPNTTAYLQPCDAGIV